MRQSTLVFQRRHAMTCQLRQAGGNNRTVRDQLNHESCRGCGVRWRVLLVLGLVLALRVVVRRHPTEPGASRQ